MKQLFFLICFGTLTAIPQLPIVIDGVAAFDSPNETTLRVTASDHAIIDWSQFSIHTNEHAEFIQPSATSSVLNRVTSAAPSLLFGRLSGNGQVLLINPNGILVGHNAEIHTGSFIASTLDLQNSVYLARGELFFEGLGGPIEHKGSIHSSGDVLLMGQSISHSGTIQAKNAALVASQEVVASSGIERIYIRSQLAGNKNNPFSRAFIRGEISAPGGDVMILGDSVKLETATIDVSNHGGGGHIYVGGGYQGNDPNIPASLLTYVGDDVLLNASAIDGGNGGQVVVWSDGSTDFRGRIEAVGVNGGSAEVSGSTGLIYKGYTDLHPFDSNGIFGTLLLDPSDILIDNNGGVSAPAFVPPTYDPVAGAAVLDITDLNTALGSASILVQTNAGVGGNGDITLASSALAGVNWSADTKLTLRADRHLTINNNIIANTAYTGLGDQIELIADSGNTGTGDLIIHQVAGSFDVSTSDGPISMRGANINIGNPAVTSNVSVLAQGTRGSMTINTPGLLLLQSPGVGFNGFAFVSSALGQTINAGNWSILGPGLPTVGTPTTWLSTGPVTAIVTGDTLFQGFANGGGFDSVRVDLQTFDLDTNNFSIIGGTDNNSNTTVITAGAQNIRVNNGMIVRAGSGNTSYARITSGSTQIIRARDLQLFGGTLTAPNANAEIISNGTQTITLTGLLTMVPGDGNTTHCLVTANSGNQIISSASLTMIGGTSTFGNCWSEIECLLGNQNITTGPLVMTSGTTPGQNGAGCHIVADVGTQTVSAASIDMVAGNQLNTRCEILGAGNQIINCAGDINITGFLSVEFAQILTGGTQTVNATNIHMTGQTTLGMTGMLGPGGLQTIDVANDFTLTGIPLLMTQTRVTSNFNQQIANIGNNFIMTGNGMGSSATCDCGDNSIVNVGANWTEIGAGGIANYSGGSNLLIDVALDYSLDSTTGGDASFSCNDNLSMNIGANLAIGASSSQGTQSINVTNGTTGGCTIRIANDLTITGGSALNARSAINVREDYLIAAGNDILIQGGSGVSAEAGITQSFTSNSNVRLLIAHNDITFRGGSGDQAYGYSQNYSNHQIRAGRDLTIVGGVGLSGEAFVSGFGIDATIPFSIGVQAGRDISISGGASSSGASYGYVELFNGALSLSSGRNIFLTGGSGAANNHALIGTPWVNVSPLIMPAPNDTTQTTIRAPGHFIAQNGPTGSIAYIDPMAAGIIPPDVQMVFPPLFINNNGSLTIETAGDITLSSGFNASEAPVPFNVLIHDITIVADSPLAAGALWAGTSDPFLSGTPLFSASSAVPANVRGGFKIDTGSLGGGIALTSVAGNIHLSSAEFFTNNSLDNLIIGPIATLNNLTLNSVTGNITVDPFHNITITNPVTTGGSVLMIAQNNILMTPTGLITAGGSVELVCDNQAPVAPLVGPGAFLMDAGASITAGAALRIFTARQSQNSIFGLLNGLPFIAGAFFSDTNQERWCVYYPEPILGTPFTIFYKECLGAILSQQVGPIVSEFLVDLHPYDEFLPGWIMRFSIADLYEDPFSPEPYFLRRRQLKVVNHPKTIVGL